MKEDEPHPKDVEDDVGSSTVSVKATVEKEDIQKAGIALKPIRPSSIQRIGEKTQRIFLKVISVYGFLNISETSSKTDIEPVHIDILVGKRGAVKGVRVNISIEAVVGKGILVQNLI